MATYTYDGRQVDFDAYTYTTTSSNTTDWGSPMYWSQQSPPLSTGKQQFLLQQAQAQSWLEARQDIGVKHLVGTVKSLTDSLEEAREKIRWYERPKPIKRTMSPLVGVEQTQLEKLWSDTNKWLSTVHIR
jgi:hypothetical protein